MVNSCNTIPPLSNSDHYGIIMELNRKPAKSEKTNGRLIWRYSYADWNTARELIDTFNWDSIMSDDVELSWKQWHQQFMRIMSQTIPNRLLPSRRNLPWLNKSIVRSMKKRNLLFKRAKTSGNFGQFKLARNRTVAMLRRAKLNYFRKLNPRDPKKFWKTVKLVNMNKQPIPTLSHDGRIADSDGDKANMLNSFFYSCFNQSHPPVAECYPPCFSCPEDVLCSEQEVCDLLAALDVTKASGQDGISTRMLRYTALSIAPSLTQLFNLSLKSGVIPSDWKKSLIVPIPKNSDGSKPTNYRPISLLPIISKVLERHVYSLVMEHLLCHHPLASCQWGFLEGRSTVTALLHCTNEWLKALEDGKEVCAVFFDFRKAFDSIPHTPLMTKLVTLGLDEHIICWLNNYLANRTQSVVVNGSISDPVPVLSGVPQGSVLGPLLFLIYIDDLPAMVSNLYQSKVNLFADDVLLYHLISNAADYTVLQEAITLLEDWSITNYLDFNVSKCKYMIISRRNSPTLPPIQLHLLGDPLQRVECYKYLGLLISSNMSWSTHITATCSKAKQILGLLYRRFYGTASPDTLKQLYLSMVRPHLDYACQIWDPHLAKDKKKLEDVQKFGCRLASHQWDSTYQDLLQLYELPSLEELRLHLKLGLMFKIIHNLCYYPDTPSFRDNVHSRAAHAFQFRLPFAHTNAYYFSYFPHTMSVWNSLDNKCVTSSTYSSFMYHLRT